MTICSNCGCEISADDKIYDVFQDGLILYCEDCYIDYLAKLKGVKND